jgi:hypothetical protein
MTSPTPVPDLDESRVPLVAPSLDDPIANAATDVLGGPLGRHARRIFDFSNVTRVLVLLTLLVLMVGVMQRGPCVNNAWTAGTEQYTNLCYSDIGHEYQTSGLESHAAALRTITQFGYPVVVAAAMQIAAGIANHLGVGVIAQTQWFYGVTVWILAAFAILTVLALIGLSGRRPWDAAMFALAPALLLVGTVNWDLIGVGLTTIALLAWARNRPVVAGLLLGFAEAAKFYPVLLLIPLLVLCWRTGRMDAFMRTAGATVVGWLIVTVPVLLTAGGSWLSYYYSSNWQPVVGNGSFWLVLDTWFKVDLTSVVNTAAIIMLGALWLAVALLGLLAERRPRVGQLAFLTVASFVLVNKVYSPQYSLWLVPLAILARPRWRDFLIWQLCDAVYYVSIWLYLLGVSVPTRGLPVDFYVIAIVIHMAGVVYFAVQVVRDILDPARDPVRLADVDDPVGGVLVGAYDVFGYGPGDDDYDDEDDDQYNDEYEGIEYDGEEDEDYDDAESE